MIVGMCRCSAVVLLGRCWVERCNDGCRSVEEIAEIKEVALRQEYQGRVGGRLYLGRADDGWRVGDVWSEGRVFGEAVLRDPGEVGYGRIVGAMDIER